MKNYLDCTLLNVPQLEEWWDVFTGKSTAYCRATYDGPSGRPQEVSFDMALSYMSHFKRNVQGIQYFAFWGPIFGAAHLAKSAKVVSHTYPPKKKKKGPPLGHTYLYAEEDPRQGVMVKIPEQKIALEKIKQFPDFEDSFFSLIRGGRVYFTFITGYRDVRVSCELQAVSLARTHERVPRYTIEYFVMEASEPFYKGKTMLFQYTGSTLSEVYTVK